MKITTKKILKSSTDHSYYAPGKFHVAGNQQFILFSLTWIVVDQSQQDNPYVAHTVIGWGAASAPMQNNMKIMSKFHSFSKKIGLRQTFFEQSSHIKLQVSQDPLI